MEVAMNLLTNIDPVQLEMPFFLTIVGLMHVCGVLLFAQLL
jgi:hypothetical protein